ncbi:ONCM protein, partial [Anseranas semipalmata]|nr:ONCM protein [Anseranas semipalmata]
CPSPPSPSSSSPAVAKGLFLLWAVPARSAQSPSLQQIHALVRHMAEDAQELFDFYEQDQRLAFNRLCRSNASLEWLRGTVVTGTGGLRTLHRAMARMDRELQDIAQHQRDLNPPGAPILRRLDSTRLKVRGLLSNLEGVLSAHGVVPSVLPPPRPPTATKVFQQKLEGCRILWNYARFMAKLSAQLDARRQRARREERRQQRRGWRRGRRPARS